MSGAAMPLTQIKNMNDITVPPDTTDRLAIRRTDEERERDRVLIARMYVRGRRQFEMLQELNKMYPPERHLTPKAIHLDLQAIQKAWAQSTLYDFNAAKVKELARLDEAEREAWDAWERSKEKHVRVEYEISDDQVPFSADKIADVKRKKRRKVIEATVGDIKYLEMVERLIKMRCDIIGLFSAQKFQIDWRTEALQSGMDEATIDAVREKTIETLVQAIEEAAKSSGAISEADIIDVESIDNGE
jgi:hypothetical protein